jgi:hypothetical protein
MHLIEPVSFAPTFIVLFLSLFCFLFSIDNTGYVMLTVERMLQGAVMFVWN